jgi:hypothetical protein
MFQEDKWKQHKKQITRVLTCSWASSSSLPPLYRKESNVITQPDQQAAQNIIQNPGGQYPLA